MVGTLLHVSLRDRPLNKTEKPILMCYYPGRDFSGGLLKASRVDGQVPWGLDPQHPLKAIEWQCVGCKEAQCMNELVADITSESILHSVMVWAIAAHFLLLYA